MKELQKHIYENFEISKITNMKLYISNLHQIKIHITIAKW